MRAASAKSQQAAAAMKRSIAMSRQIAVLQAQALLTAAGSMEVCYQSAQPKALQ